MKKKFISLDEFIIKSSPCKNGRFCNVENCKFSHVFKTKLCKFGNKCMRKNNCSFAHSQSEIYIPECKFKNRCNNDSCKFKHPIKLIEPEPVKRQSSCEFTEEEFPIVISSSSEISDEKIVDYSKMKSVIKYIDSAYIQKDNIKDMIKEFESIVDFGSITFELSPL